MPRISQMPPPELPLSGLELLPAIQGGGVDANIGLPLLTIGPPFGGDVLALRVPVTADMTSTVEGDPGAGGVRWNHSTPALATELYVSNVDGDAGDLIAVFAGLRVGGVLYLQGSVDSESRDNWQRWQVTNIGAESGYVKLAVALKLSGGSFEDGDQLELTIQQPIRSAEPAGVVELTGNAYTLGDLVPGAWHVFTAASPVVLTVEDDSVTPVPADAEYGLECRGAGGVTLVKDNVATIIPPKGGSLELESGDFAVLKRTDTDTYKLIGSTAEAP
jgi:hypothetical protein